ncbi:MAG: phospholipase A [Ginsengibacter sp.]
MVTQKRVSIYVRHLLFILLYVFLDLASTAQVNSLFKKDAVRQTMSQRWELDSSSRKGTFLVTPYKPLYVTAGRWTNSPNVQPYSENPAYSLPFKVNYNNYEAKFQLSLKTKIFQNIFKTGGDLWVGYTQKAHWQVYNAKLSRPFRELNYEPELILNFPVNISLLGFKVRMLGVSLTHQSNGRTLPLSRSWNRVIFQAGLDRKNWQIYLRPWIRLHDEDDENPDICDYIGRGEAIVIYNAGRQQFSLIGTHTLRFGKRNRGRIEANWVFPVIGNLRLQLKVADGYGETLVDYNHSQFTVGISVSLIEW